MNLLLEVKGRKRYNMKKILAIMMLVIMLTALVGCATRDTDTAAAASSAACESQEIETSTVTRIYGTPYEVCHDIGDGVRTYTYDSVRVDAVDGYIETVGTTMVSVTLSIDDVTETILRQEASVANGYVGLTLVTADQLVNGDGTATPALIGAYAEVVLQLRKRDIPGKVCITLYEVDEETLDFIRVTRGW